MVNKNDQILTDEELAKKLISKICCGQEMVLEGAYEEAYNKICRKYVCSKCKKTLFNSGIKPKEKITLTIEQRKKIFHHLGSIEEILYKAENKEEEC